jgi:hypothetical protein
MSFIKKLKRVINTGQARVVILTGNIHDLFFNGHKYVPLLEYLSTQCQAKPTGSQRGITQLIYKLNNPIELRGSNAAEEELDGIWKTMSGSEQTLGNHLSKSNRNTTFALELMRQLTECNRRSGRRSCHNLLLMLEAADLLIPENEINRMSISDRHRVGILHDWFCDPSFMDGGDTVILLAESRSHIHHRIARLPHVMSIEVPLPNMKERRAYVEHFGISGDSVPEHSSGLSIHALRQFLKSGDHSPDALTAKVEEYMVSQVGEGVIEFKRPTHSLKDVIGAKLVKTFMEKELIPGFLDGSIGGAAVGGPIGGGKTFICEAVATELGIPVITLKNIRSKWYGETDAIFERLQRLLKTFHRIVIFVDEADTQFGSVSEGHATERRLTGKIQAMMSDVQLRGKVIWFLMTARIHLLSPDIRRPGRMDLIIPVLDPIGEDRDAFLRWCCDSLGDSAAEEVMEEVTTGYSAAAFAMLRSRIRAKGCDIDGALAIARDMVLPDIEEVREYQTLQAQLNCTRLSLLSTEVSEDARKELASLRTKWKKGIAKLEAKGIR